MSQLLLQFIDGQMAESTGSAQTFLGAEGELAHWKCAEEMDVIRALQSAKKFLSKPVAMTLEERLDILKKIKNILVEKSEDWAHQEALYQNLPQSFVLENGFRHVENLIDKNIKALESFSFQKTVLSPTGVMAVITAWPLSFRLVMESLVPSLAAGNAIIVKVSSRSPITAKILQEIAKIAELPAGSLQVLLGEGSRVGAFLAAHPGVRGVSFVGKTKTAESIIKATATQFKKLQLRGSAKNSAIVLPGFKESQIQDLLPSFLVAQGQTGWSMSRLLTTESEAPALMEILKSALPKSSFPKTMSGLQVDLIKKAQQEHAKLLLPDFSGPSFLLDLPNCSDLQQEELQAPVFPIITVKYMHELAKWSNNTSYGNLATIWGDPDKAMKIAEKLEVGGIWVNHWMRSQDESPWGLKQSSFGIPETSATGRFFSDQKLTV